MFSGYEMEKDGEAVWEIRKCTPELEVGEQGDRCYQTGGLGRDAESKKFETTHDRLVPDVTRREWTMNLDLVDNLMLEHLKEN
jgi:hypothetical protein